MLPHHVNCHVEHHLFPAVPRYNLTRLHGELDARAVLQRAGVRSVRDTFARMFAERAGTGASSAPG